MRQLLALQQFAPMRNAWSKLKRILLRGHGVRLAVGALLTPAPALMSCRAAAGSSSRSDAVWPQIVNPRRLTLLFWLYIAQAVAGSAVGFTAPFLYYFGVL